VFFLKIKCSDKKKTCRKADILKAAAMTSLNATGI